jgi:hypothetical protein
MEAVVLGYVLLTIGIGVQNVCQTLSQTYLVLCRFFPKYHPGTDPGSEQMRNFHVR